MNFLAKLLLSAISVIIASYLLPGVIVESFWSALIVAAFLAILNVTLKPILIVLTIPITFITLGLFLLVINALMILLADQVIPGFRVEGFWWAIGFSLILSILTSVFDDLLGKNKK
ncbi:MAG: phage holin family protein [Bacteroidetes bacterium]|nr:phage holin family protein [Bacteroidota bacterium]